MAITINGTPGAAAATSITLPAHAAGDVILIWAYKDGATTIPTVPTAGGTVPTWVTIDGPTGANTNAAVACYAIATATNHTSGTWTGATGMSAIVLRGADNSTVVGGHTQTGGTGANTCLAPSVTLTDSSGASAIVHFGGARNVTAWGALGAGYTSQASVATEVRCITKDTTTTDGTQSLVPTNVVSGSGYRAQTIEVLVPQGTSYTKSGNAIAGGLSSGADVDVASETGSAILGVLGTGTDIDVASETANAIIGTLARGADAFLAAEAGRGIAGASGSGIDTFVPGTPSGNTYVETGAGVIG